jgi:hypothetical protein
VSNAEDLRQQAREILRGSRFHDRKTPGPFAGLFRRLGDLLDPVLGPIGRFFSRVFETIARWWAEPLGQAIFVILVIGIAVAISTLVIRRRTAVSFGGSGRGRQRAEDDPAALEREADRAEADGHFAEAVRLRFRAGVVRLQRDGVVRRGRSTPTRAIGRQLHIDEFDRLGQTFDAVAYGGRPASAQDAADARRDWERVLAAAGTK